MLGVRYGRLALAKLSSRRYEDRAIEGERCIWKGIGKLCKAESESASYNPLILRADRISLKELMGNPGAWGQNSIGWRPPEILAWAKSSTSQLRLIWSRIVGGVINVLPTLGHPRIFVKLWKMRARVHHHR